MARKRLVLRDGEFVAQKPGEGGWRAPEHMRQLPEDYYTRDTSDPDRIHELDPPHIVEALKADRDKVQEEESRPPPMVEDKRFAPHGVRAPITQTDVDFIRFRIMRQLIHNNMRKISGGQALGLDNKIRHVWFPEPHIDKYSLRRGKPPPDSKRPKWLRGIKLAISLSEWPEAIVDIMRERGQLLPNIKRLREETMSPSGLLQ